MPDLTTKDAMLERMVAATNGLDDKFDEYLPLSGGTLTGALKTSSTITTFSNTLEKGTNPSSEAYPQWLVSCDKNGTDIKNRICGIAGIINTSGDVSYGIVSYKYEANATSYVGAFLTNPASGDAAFRPSTDNTINLGRSNNRWKQLYAGTATINTSDERLKDNIEPIPDEVLDAWGEVQWQQFQFKDSLKEKGKAARIHVGLIAQRVIKAFAEHGLDALRYGVVCYDAWEADDDIAAGDLYSLRYEEALCLESAYQRRELKRLVERIEALEAKRSRKK